MSSPAYRVAILFPGDWDARQNATSENNRFTPIFRALAEIGLSAEPAVYNDELVEPVKAQLLNVHAVLVWVNPIEGGRDRSVLDAMLREIARRGVFVSAHPDIILKMGTKEVLYETRKIGWGCDTHIYRSMEELRRDLPGKLAKGEVRVLKQYRGNGGDGVWKVRCSDENKGRSASIDMPVFVRHAKRGSIEAQVSLSEFITSCEPYFSYAGRMIDQAYQERLPEGMIRCYFVGNEVAGFGHQEINALYPAPPGAPASAAPQPGPRLYHPPSKPEFQVLRRWAEDQWVPEMQKVLGISTEELPVIWDADFLLGQPDKAGQDTYVLCEINVSSVAPFPDSTVPRIAEVTKERIFSRTF